MRSIRFAYFAVVVMVLAGCESHYIAELDSAPLPPPLVDPLPFAVGVYYSPDFRSRETFVDWGTWGVTFKLGPPSVTKFDQALKATFETVVPVDSLPAPRIANNALAGIIAPEFLSFWQLPPHSCKPPCKFPASIKYAATLYNPSGAKLGDWSFEGSGQVDPYRVSFNIEKIGGVAASRAIRAAVAKFIREFRKQPFVKSWLAANGVGANARLSRDGNSK